jgi:hypothetical protein
MPLESCPSSVNIGRQFVVRGLCATIRIAHAIDVAGRGAHARRARRTIGQRLINRAHRPRRANGDGGRTSLGGPPLQHRDGATQTPPSPWLLVARPGGLGRRGNPSSKPTIRNRPGPLLQTTSLRCEERDNSAKAAHHPTRRFTPAVRNAGFTWHCRRRVATDGFYDMIWRSNLRDSRRNADRNRLRRGRQPRCKRLRRTRSTYPTLLLPTVVSRISALLTS